MAFIQFSAARFSLMRLISDMVALRRHRIALRDMPAERLADIGLTEEAARREAARPLWDVPSHWQDFRAPF